MPKWNHRYHWHQLWGITHLSLMALSQLSYTPYLSGSVAPSSSTAAPSATFPSWSLKTTIFLTTRDTAESSPSCLPPLCTRQAKVITRQPCPPCFFLLVCPSLKQFLPPSHPLHLACLQLSSGRAVSFHLAPVSRQEECRPAVLPLLCELVHSRPQAAGAPGESQQEVLQVQTRLCQSWESWTESLSQKDIIYGGFIIINCNQIQEWDFFFFCLSQCLSSIFNEISHESIWNSQNAITGYNWWISFV